MGIIDNILSLPEFKSEPPVLIDIGASGGVHKIWDKISRYSIGIAFDGDERDYQENDPSAKKFLKLHKFRCLISDSVNGKIDFYLTRYPHCSSTLHPDNESLQDWAYASFFEVLKKTEVPARTLSSILQELHIQRVDWFKADTQGTDLRLFKSLGEAIYNSVLIAEFEPGLLDSYQKEDKMHHVLSFFDENKNFWLSKLIIKGSQKIAEKNFHKLIPSKYMRKLLMAVGHASPGWGEMTYVRKLKEDPSKRDLLLGWVFSTLLDQHGYAYDLAIQAVAKFPEDIFLEMKSHSASEVKSALISSKYFSLLVQKIKRSVGES